MNTERLFLSYLVGVTIGIWAMVIDLRGVVLERVGGSAWLTVEIVAVFELFIKGSEGGTEDASSFFWVVVAVGGWFFISLLFTPVWTVIVEVYKVGNKVDGGGTEGIVV